MTRLSKRFPPNTKVGYFHHKRKRYPISEGHQTSFTVIPKERVGELREQDGITWLEDTHRIDREVFGNYQLSYGTMSLVDRSSHARWRFGFEAEKENYNKPGSRRAFKDAGYCIEHDCSLDDDSGYEMVSPMYDLFGDQLDKDLAEHKWLVDSLNGGNDYGSDNCGGHMSISEFEKPAMELYREIRAWIPLIFALYPYRSTTEYSSMRSEEEYTNIDRCGRDCMYISNKNRMEIRIFPEIESVEDLLWRRELLRLAVINRNVSFNTIALEITRKRSPLRKLIESHPHRTFDLKTLSEDYLGIAFLVCGEGYVKKSFVSKAISKHNLSIYRTDRFMGINKSEYDKAKDDEPVKSLKTKLFTVKN